MLGKQQALATDASSSLPFHFSLSQASCSQFPVSKDESQAPREQDRGCGTKWKETLTLRLRQGPTLYLHEPGRAHLLRFCILGTLQASS